MNNLNKLNIIDAYGNPIITQHIDWDLQQEIIALIGKKNKEFAASDKLTQLVPSDVEILFTKLFSKYYPERLSQLNWQTLIETLKENITNNTISDMNLYTAIKCCKAKQIFQRIAWFQYTTRVISENPFTDTAHDTTTIHSFAWIHAIDTSNSLDQDTIDWKAKRRNRNEINVGRLTKYLDIVQDVLLLSSEHLNSVAFEKIKASFKNDYISACRKLQELDSDEEFTSFEELESMFSEEYQAKTA
jgi:hypothetical protein